MSNNYPSKIAMAATIAEFDAKLRAARREVARKDAALGVAMDCFMRICGAPCDERAVELAGEALPVVSAALSPLAKAKKAKGTAKERAIEAEAEAIFQRALKASRAETKRIAKAKKVKAAPGWCADHIARLPCPFCPPTKKTKRKHAPNCERMSSPDGSCRCGAKWSGR